MLELEELRLRLLGMKPQIDDLADALGLEQCRAEVRRLEAQQADPDFWNDVETSSKVQKKMSQLNNKIASHKDLENRYDDAMTLIEMASEEDDRDLYEEALAEVDKLAEDVDRIKLTTLLTGEYDDSNAILTFHAGAGGTEAQDWCQMLYRMYTAWATRHNYKYTLVDWLDGEDAGLKSATIIVEGENAYGFLKSENGVHRLVRISPFDASGRRHTSFASLEVMPEIEDDKSIEIREEDIKMDVYRASGAGGQKVNKTSSAVRLIHKPTGIVVSCQEERSQLQNREKCMLMLSSKLYQIEQERIETAYSGERRSQVGTGMRNEKIRTYNFPQSRVTDHRIGLTLYKIDSIMNGDLDEIIDALVSADQAEKLRESGEST